MQCMLSTLSSKVLDAMNGAVIYMNKKYFKFKMSYVFVCRIEPKCEFIHVPAFRN